MNVQEVYEAAHGDFEGTLERMMDEGFMAKILMMFLDDPSFMQLKEAYQAQNVSDSFHAAHTLKGVAGNVGLSDLAKKASDVTEALRNSDNIHDADAYMPALMQAYETAKQAIEKLEA